MYEITMPKLSDTMTEGTLVSWLKAVGDQVERGELVAEVETDKATMELEAFAEGVLLEIKAQPGDTVAVGTVIGIIGKAEEKPNQKTEPTTEKKAEEKEIQPQPEEQQAEPAAAGDKEMQAAPVIRQRAKALGIDLATVLGSGPDGRIMLEDLERPKSAAAGSPGAETKAKTQAARPEEEERPLSRMRAAIARTVTESWRTIPHFSVTAEVRMDEAEALRGRYKEDGAAVSVTALLLRASALALKKHPGLNASLRNERIIIHPEINIGIVVGLDDGLLVPVLKGCGELTLEEIAQRAKQLVERARNRQLSDKELSGGTFAISNMGMYQVQSFNALIQPPMAAMLAVGAVRDGVIVQDGRPAVARLMSLTLSIDHRLVDGAHAAEFLQSVKQLLEKPDGLKESREK